ncbi:MAG TPA: AAA family ATPase [Baekduia sp.]|nr:AAA family ATPase [Baekduia sp.]
MTTATVSRRLVGRDAELTALREALGEAGAGRAGLVLVAGESGVGKTRLLSELAQLARDEGARVLTGECVELGDGELPYAPLIGALRPLVRASDPVLAELPETCLRELAAILPGLGAEALHHAEPASGLRPDAQPRLFEALLTALERLGRDAPLLLVLEDLHWADRSTRDFLAFLARNLAEERVLVAASYRPDELHRRHPLRPLLAALERAALARRIELRGLTPPDVAALAQELLGEEPTAELVERLVRRSDGNALFVEELLAAGPKTLPPSLSDALMLRIERLPAPAQELVRVLAVAHPASHAHLQEVAELDPATLSQALRDAIAGHVVRVDDDRYAFRHVLLREVVLDDLLPGERAALHLAAARALARRVEAGDPEPGLTAAAAHHFHAAADQPEALRWAVRAARGAADVHARSGAAALLERALELWERVPDAEALVGFDHVDLLGHTADALRAVDEGRRLTLIGEALREVRAARPDDPRASSLLRERALTEWALGRGEASRATLDLARRLLPDDAPPADRLDLTVARLKMALLQSRFGEVIELGREAEAEAEVAEADPALAGEVRYQRIRIVNSVGHALIMVGEHDRGCALLREAIAEGIAGGYADLLGVSYLNLGDALNLRGRSDEALAVVAEGLQRAEQGLMTPPNVIWLRAAAAEIAIERGDYGAAREQLDAIGRTSGHTRANVELRLAELALAQDDHDGARVAIEEAEALLADALEPQFVSIAGTSRAELERRTGALECAREAVEAALERVEFCSDDTVRIGRLAVTGVAIDADAAQRARDLGDPEAEEAALARAEVMLSRARAVAEGTGPVERALAATAEAHLLRGRGAAAAGAWREVADAWRALEARPRVAAALWRAADASLAAGDRDEAAVSLHEALALARAMGAAWLTAELETLAARGRLPLGAVDGAAPGTAAAPAAGTAADDDPFGLTPRERQVLRLVAGGATNREIGAELFMAEKTASVHVSRILAKLDVRSRTEAAAVAHRLGLS